MRLRETLAHFYEKRGGTANQCNHNCLVHILRLSR